MEGWCKLRWVEGIHQCADHALRRQDQPRLMKITARPRTSAPAQAASRPIPAQIGRNIAPLTNAWPPHP